MGRTCEMHDDDDDDKYLQNLVGISEGKREFWSRWLGGGCDNGSLRITLGVIL
jgi:hypothetical protein